MKLHKKSFLGFAFATILFVSCSNEGESIQEKDVFELVGTEETRTATAKELSMLSPVDFDKVNCTLHGDEGCSEDSRSEFERYVRECTSYTRNWPPNGTVNIYYRSLIYYVDGDGDINLDHYQNDLQTQVTSIVGSGGAAFVDADIIHWTCNERENNACVIKYSVYR